MLEAGAMPRLAALTEKRGNVLGKSAEDITKGRSQFDLGHASALKRNRLLAARCGAD